APQLPGGSGVNVSAGSNFATFNLRAFYCSSSVYSVPSVVKGIHLASGVAVLTEASYKLL
ncbi:MAG: hypothetical protein WCR44_09535, partial [Verrucomicrobiota bacterium]